MYHHLMYKLVVIIILALLIVSFVACTNGTSGSNNSTPNPSTTVTSSNTASPKFTPTVDPNSLYQRIIKETQPGWSDPLNSSVESGGWTIYQTKQTGCHFVSGNYQTYANVNGYISPCFASKIHVTNFAFSVNMTVSQGSVVGGGGGIIFRAASDSYNAAMYRFDVRPTKQTFDILAQASSSQRFNPACGPNNQEYCFNTAIQQSGTNLLVVIAEKNCLYFYVNDVFLTEVNNDLNSSGLLGVFAVDDGQNTVVEFNNARVWYL